MAEEEEKENDLIKRIRENPSEIGLRIDLGKYYEDEKKYNEACDVYLQIIEFDDGNIEANLGYSRSLLNVAETMTSQSIHYFINAVPRSVNPYNKHETEVAARSYYNLGSAFQHKVFHASLSGTGIGEDLEIAATHYQSALEYNPKYVRPLVSLGFVYETQGRVPEALECYEDASKLEPENDTILSNLGDAYVKVGEYPKALESYKSAIEVIKKRHNNNNNSGANATTTAATTTATTNTANATNSDSSSSSSSSSSASTEKKDSTHTNNNSNSPQDEIYRQKLSVLYNGIGVVYRDIGEETKALESFRAAVELVPSLPQPHQNISSMLRNKEIGVSPQSSQCSIQ